MRLKVVMTALAISMFWALQLFAGSKIIDRIDIDLALEKAPEVEYSRGKDPTAKIESVNRWLVIRIWYTIDKENFKVPVLQKKSNSYNLQLNGFADDLGVRVKVLQNTGLQASGKALYGLYTGETAFYSVRRDGRKHLVMMFIPGKLLDRFSRSSNGQIRASSKSDFKVEVVFTVAGRDVGKAYSGGDAKLFKEAMQMVPENMVFKGGVFPRSRTPWAFRGMDDFDVEKELPGGKY